MLKLLTGELKPDIGTVIQAKTLAGIVIDQQRKLMEPDKRVKDVLANGGDWIDVRGAKKHIKGYLKEFLFDPSLTDAPIGSLSGGERSRLLLAREFARAANLLVLDEPTNDLDLETLDLLQEVIADYDGTVLIVSHDRDFLDRTVTITLGLDGSGKVDIVAGGYEDWIRQRYEARRAPCEGRSPDAGHAAKEAGPLPSQGSRKLCYKDQRDYDRLPGEIEKLQAKSRPTKTRYPTLISTRATPTVSPSLPSAIARNRAEDRSRRTSLARGRRNGRGAGALGLRPGALLDPPFEDGERHRAVLQHFVELLDVEFCAEDCSSPSRGRAARRGGRPCSCRPGRSRCSSAPPRAGRAARGKPVVFCI